MGIDQYYLPYIMKIISSALDKELMSKYRSNKLKIGFHPGNFTELGIESQMRSSKEINTWKY